MPKQWESDPCYDSEAVPSVSGLLLNAVPVFGVRMGFANDETSLGCDSEAVILGHPQSDTPSYPFSPYHSFFTLVCEIGTGHTTSSEPAFCKYLPVRARWDKDDGVGPEQLSV